MASQNEVQASAEIKLEEKEAAIVELACMIGFGAHQSLSDQFDNARDLGLSDAELSGVVSKAMCVKNSARDLTNKTANQKLGVTINTTDCCADEEVSRPKEIAAISSAVGSSCLTNYQKHIVIGKEAGLSDGEVDAITKMAFTMKAELQEDFEYSIEHPEAAATINEGSGAQQDCSAGDSPCCSPSEKV